MAWNLYDRFREGQQDSRQINLDLINMYFAIATNTYVPNQNTDEFFSTPETNEVSGTNYTAGGNQGINPIVSMDGVGLITFDSDDPAVWAQNAAGFANGRRFIGYDKTGGSSAVWRLIVYSDAEAADFGNVAGPLTLQLAAAGIWTQAR